MAPLSNSKNSNISVLVLATLMQIWVLTLDNLWPWYIKVLKGANWHLQDPKTRHPYVSFPDTKMHSYPNPRLLQIFTYFYLAKRINFVENNSKSRREKSLSSIVITFWFKRGIWYLYFATQATLISQCKDFIISIIE